MYSAHNLRMDLVSSQPFITTKVYMMLALGALCIVGIVYIIYFHESKHVEVENITKSVEMPKESSMPVLVEKPIENPIEKPIEKALLEVKSLRESWCFVGEDLSGRYCVKVPSEEACDPSRTFLTESDCEIVKASHMPLGITKDGSDFRPLETMKFSDQ